MPAVVWTFEGDTRDLEAALNQVQGSVNETNKDLQQTGKEGQKGFKLTEEGAKKALYFLCCSCLSLCLRFSGLNLLNFKFTKNRRCAASFLQFIRIF